MYHIIFDEENSNIKKYTIYFILGGGIASIIPIIFNEYAVLTFVFIFLLANIIIYRT